MAGMIPSSSKPSGRKQWTLHDGPRGSLQRLRNQLAEDGCPESQVILAKQLLEERCELDFDRNENARIAVYWLIKSSEQGHEEATILLEKCFRSGRGINEHNYLDVKSCINMSQEEKLARKAARDMFASLSNGEDFITSNQLQKRMIEIYKNENIVWQNKRVTEDFEEQLDENIVNNNEDRIRSNEDNVDWTKRIETDNRKLTEENVISAAVNYAHGELPVVNQVLCLTTPNLKALDHVPYFHRSLFYPRVMLKILYYKFVRFFGTFYYFSPFPVARTEIQLLILFLAYVLVSSDSILLFIPMALYYISFVTMIVTTFQSLQIRHYDYTDFRIWSGLFLTYSGGTLNADEAEFQFIRNNLKPFGQFFLALLINLMVYPTVADQWIPQSEFTVIAFCLTFLTLMTFSKKQKFQKHPDLLLLFSFGINVLARYPYEYDAVVTQGWRFLDLKVPSFASYIIGNGIEFCLTFRLLFFLIIPICFVKIAMLEKGRGIYKYLIPHCLSLSWLQIVIINSQGATMYGLLRGTLALVGIVLFVPLAGLASFLLPVVAVANYVYESDYFVSLIFITCFSVSLLVPSWILSKTKYNEYITFWQICWGILSIVILLSISYFNSTKSFDNEINNLYEYENEQFQENTLSWEQYQKFCHQQSWEEESLIWTQWKCAQLDGIPVKWEGYVSKAKVKLIKNPLKSIISNIPIAYIRDKLYCIFGENSIKNNNCTDFENNNDLNCFLQKKFDLNEKCRLDAWDKYDFEIIVKILSGAWGKTTDVVLNIEDNSFKNFTMELKAGDRIWFYGLLSNDYEELIGGVNLHIKLKEIGCKACQNVNLTSHKLGNSQKIDIELIFSYIFVSVKYVINFLLNPIVLCK